jgi:hypothetical protein
MIASRLGAVVLAALAAGLIPTTSACYVEGEVPPPEYSYGYEPQYYGGYLVYYDDVGRPFYYVDGALVWVPVTAAAYVGLVNHWRLHVAAYRHWYGGHPYSHHAFHGGGGRR